MSQTQIKKKKKKKKKYIFGHNFFSIKWNEALRHTHVSFEKNGGLESFSGNEIIALKVPLVWNWIHKTICKYLIYPVP